jgi:hypothetical protein
MTLYLALREEILADAEPDLRLYVTGLDRIVSGNISFCTAAVRYLLSDSTYTVTRVETPSDTRTAPLPYPTIAWWWDHLTP